MTTAHATENKRPDHMGVWNDGGDRIWLPKEHYPRRSAAIAWAVQEWTCAWTEVRCLSRWMRYTPHIARNGADVEVWRDDYWSECDRSEAGAFPVWRLEAT